MAKATLKSTKTANSNSNSGVLKLVEKCILSAKTAMQAINELEKTVSDTAIACLKHAHDHGDVMPAHRLVIGLRELNHPATTRLSDETVAWFRSNSPIRWNAKGEPRQLKEGEEGYKPYDEESATETPFYETPVAKRARQAMADSHKRTLEPVTFQDVLNRMKGIMKFVENAQKPDKNGDVRSIKKGEGTKIKKLLTDFQGFMTEHGVIEEVKDQEPKAA